jgi:hypothetical protein
VISLPWKALALTVVALLLATTLLRWVLPGADLDQRIPVGPGGSAVVDLELEGGFSLEPGSLTIRSHEADDVHVAAETSGWGTYAVALDLSATQDRVTLVGRVDGALSWLFGGPTVDVRLWVPRDFTVEARVSGVPIDLEDLVAPLVVSAQVEEGDVSLRRSAGRFRLATRAGAIEVEDLTGDLDVRSQNGEIDVDGVRGSVSATAEHGEVEIGSVRGPVHVGSGGGRRHGSVDVEEVDGEVTVEVGRGEVEIERVKGPVSVRTDRGAIDVEEVDGDIVARTEAGAIELANVDGNVRARSERGAIEITFRGVPRGEVETGRGDIHVATPGGVGFDLDARSGRGEIVVASDGAPGAEDGEASRGRSREAQWVQPVRGGGPLLRLRTSRGSIAVD